MASVRVAVGVLIDPASRVLITRRRQQAHQGGLWEFPGGKVEAGESVTGALQRELQEELGVVVGAPEALLTIDHSYSDTQVTLAVYVIRSWQGEPYGAEGQPLAWVPVAQLADYDFPAANTSIVSALRDLLQ